MPGMATGPSIAPDDTMTSAGAGHVPAIAQPMPNSAPPWMWCFSGIERESESSPPNGVFMPRRSRR